MGICRISELFSMFSILNKKEEIGGLHFEEGGPRLLKVSIKVCPHLDQLCWWRLLSRKHDGIRWVFRTLTPPAVLFGLEGTELGDGQDVGKLWSSPGWKFWLSAIEMKVEYVGRFEGLPCSTPLLPSLWAQSGKKKGGSLLMIGTSQGRTHMCV